MRATKYKNVGVILLLVLAFFLFKSHIFFIPLHWDEICYAGVPYQLAQPPLYPTKFFDNTFMRLSCQLPLHHLLLAFMYSVFGFSIMLTHLYAIIWPTVSLYYTYRLGAHFGGVRTGVLALMFLFSSPLFFAQSGLASRDGLLTAFTAMATYFFITDNASCYLIASCALVLTKESGLAYVVPIAVYQALRTALGKRPGNIGPLAFIPILVYALWVCACKLFTGKFFEYVSTVRFQELNILDLEIIKATFLGFFIRQYSVLLSLLIAAYFLSFWRNRGKHAQGEVEVLFITLAGILCLSLSIPWLLPRYLLFLKPLFSTLGAVSVMRLFRHESSQIIVSLAIILLFISSWYSKDGTAADYLFGENDRYYDTMTREIGKAITEKNMEYLDLVNAYWAVTAYISSEHPDATIVTSRGFPLRHYLSYPQMGYVKRPYTTLSLDDGRRMLENGCVYNLRMKGEFYLNDTYINGVWTNPLYEREDTVCLEGRDVLFVDDEFSGNRWTDDEFEKVVAGNYTHGRLVLLTELISGRIHITVYKVLNNEDIS